MQLYFLPSSPFVRMVRVCADELGLSDRIELIPAAVPADDPLPEFTGRFDPLHKVPTLTLDDGTLLRDTTQICVYLNTLAGGDLLLPKTSSPAHWRVLNRHAVADDAVELAMLLCHETRVRPAGCRWQGWIDAQFERLDAAIAWLGDQPGKPLGPADVPDLSRISRACLLDYLLWRLPDYGWRENQAGMARDHETFAQRPAMMNTEHH